MPELKRDIFKTREQIHEDFIQCIDTSNRIWYDTIHLIITLAASFLVLSIALVEKLFPPTNEVINLPGFLIAGWVLLFSSIIFGIIAKLESAVFHGNRARVKGRSLCNLDNKIAKGLREDTIEIKEDSDYLIKGNIVWGTICINSFILAILCLCLALLNKIAAINTCIAIFICACIFIAFTNVYLIQKRNKK